MYKTFWCFLMLTGWMMSGRGEEAEGEWLIIMQTFCLFKSNYGQPDVGSQAPTSSQCQLPRPVPLFPYCQLRCQLIEAECGKSRTQLWLGCTFCVCVCECVCVCSHCIYISYKCIQIMRIYQENSMNCKWCGSCSCELYACVCSCVCVSARCVQRCFAPRPIVVLRLSVTTLSQGVALRMRTGVCQKACKKDMERKRGEGRVGKWERKWKGILLGQQVIWVWGC